MNFKVGNCLKVFFVVVGIGFFVGCASKPKFQGKSEMCGVVVDENNIPVADFVITCKKDGVSNVAVTNESGIFVFNDMRGGKYSICGEKPGYARLAEQTFEFISREKIICCKVNSIDGAFNAIDKQISCQKYENALELLDEICFEKDSAAEATVLFYMAYVYSKCEEMKKSMQCIKRLNKLSCVDFGEEICELEELVYEME